MSVLITAFDPFGGEKINPAFECARLLPDSINGEQIIKLEVPTVFGRSAGAVISAVAELVPHTVMMVGQAGGRCAITPERVAINIDDAPIPDNEGNQPTGLPIDPSGPAAYLSGLPIDAVVTAIRAEGIPACISNSAGTFVCNHLMYSVLNHIHKNALPVRAGFIHIPFLPEQAAQKAVPPPSMSKDMIMRALRVAIETISTAR